MDKSWDTCQKCHLLYYNSANFNCPKCLAKIEEELPIINRPETGAMQFGDDWPGVFIRGDSAAYYSLTIETIKECLEQNQVCSQLEVYVLQAIIDLLRSSTVPAKDVQELKDFISCKNKSA